MSDWRLDPDDFAHDDEAAHMSQQADNEQRAVHEGANEDRAVDTECEIRRLRERLALALDNQRVQFERANRVTAERDALSEQLGRCICEPFPHGSGPEQDCGVHGRRYHEWVDRGNVLQGRISAVREVITKARLTPTKNDPYRVALDIADDLEAAIYSDATTMGRSVEDLRVALSQPPDVECCASGRCEVCKPGFDWGRDG